VRRVNAGRWLVLAIAGLVALGLYSTMQSRSPARQAEALIAPGGDASISQANPDDTAQQRDTQSADTVDASRIAVPPHLRFAGIASVAVGDSWEHLLSDYGDDERVQIEAFTQALNSTTYLFRGEAEQEWLIDQAFPMPDEILAASAMSEDELRAMAVGGNSKAAFFYLLRSIKNDSYHELDSEQDFLERSKIRAAAFAADSAFLGYIEAARASKKYPDEAHADAGALAWASTKGDTRAAYAIAGEGINPAHLLILMNSLRLEEIRLRQLGLILAQPSLRLSFPQGETMDQLAYPRSTD